MVAYNKASFDDLVLDAKKFDRTEELKKYGLGTVKAKRVNKETGERETYTRKRTFMEIKYWYYNSFYPELLPKKKVAAPTMYDKLAEL